MERLAPLLQLPEPAAAAAATMNDTVRYRCRKGWILEQGRRMADAVRRKRPEFAHVKGSSRHKHSSWIGYWRKQSGLPGDICAFLGCPNAAAVGAHVQRAAAFRRTATWYIVPACRACNNRDRARDSAYKTGMKARLKPGVPPVPVSERPVMGRRRALAGSLERPHKAAL